MSSLSRRGILKGAVGVGAAVGLSGSLAACTSDGSPKGNPSGSAPLRGGTFRLSVLDGDTGSPFDGHMATTDSANVRLRCAFDTLLDPDENIQLQNQLAEEFTMENASQYVVRLRRDIEFHNGKTATADDLIYSLRRMTDPALGAVSSGMLSAVDPNKIDKLDNYTVRLRLKEADAFLPEAIGFYTTTLVPDGYSPGGFGEGPLAQVGTGPYKVKSYTPGRQTHLVRNPNYFVEEQPYFDEIILTEFSDSNASFNSLLSGQADALGRLPFALVPQVETHSDLNLYRCKSNAKIHLAMHTQRAPFDDVRVRQAFALIADRPAIVEQAFSGYAQVANDLPAWSDPDYIGDEIAQREQDLDQAKSLLKAAGAENLSLELATSPVIEGYVELAQIFAQQAQGAGVNISVKNQDVASYYGADWPSYTFGVDSDSFTSVTRTFESECLPGGVYPMAHFDDPELNDLFAAAKREPDAATRTSLAHDMQRLVHDKVPYIQPAFIEFLGAHSSKVQGFKPDPGYHPLNNWGNGFRTCYFTE